LLAVIRSDFERIHASIKDLKPEEKVSVPGRPGLSVPYLDLVAWENDGEPTYKIRVEGKVVGLNVAELLNGVDLAGVRRRPDERDEAEAPLRVFYSYAHKDESLLNELKTHLKILERLGRIVSWHDRLIDPGQEWEDRIDENLERADLILLLVSADFMASDYCYAREMIRAMERHDADEAMVIPIAIRTADWTGAPFARLQGLPKDLKAVTLWDDRDSAWRNVSDGIKQWVDLHRKSR
jgi:internalin A